MKYCEDYADATHSSGFLHAFEDATHLLETAVISISNYITLLGVSCRRHRKDKQPVLSDMQRTMKEHGCISVWTGACATSVCPHTETNIRFRFWHDYIHITHNLDFTYPDEAKVNAIQMGTLKEYLRSIGAYTYATRVLATLIFEADTDGQLGYHKQFGKFPDDQKAFCKWYVKRKLMEGGYDYIKL